MSRFSVPDVENRRGLVLGLTLAELLLLLLFLLIAALGFWLNEWKLRAEAEAARASAFELQNSQIVASLEGLRPLVEQLQAKGGLDTSSAKEFVERLQKVDSLQQEVISLKETKLEIESQLVATRAMAARAEKYKMLDGAIAAASRVDPNDPPAVLTRAMEVLNRLGSDTKPDQVPPLSDMASFQEKIETISGEREKFRRQVENLRKSGNGLTYPSCWTTPNGQTEYIFDVTILDNGLTVKDATPSRASDPNHQFVQPFMRNAVIQENTFHKATANLFAYSKSQECRFYAIIRDGTGPTSKVRYKQMRSLVEAHFYPLHLSQEATVKRAKPSSPREANASPKPTVERQSLPAPTSHVGGPLEPVQLRPLSGENESRLSQPLR